MREGALLISVFKFILCDVVCRGGMRTPPEIVGFGKL